MDKNYTIDEILSAVDELFKKKEVLISDKYKNKLIKKDFSAVPKDTLKLIEEAENFKK
jgi:hypothetical protein